MAPLVLGIVLGDLLEKGLRRGLVLSDGDLAPFFTRPISAVLWSRSSCWRCCCGWLRCAGCVSRKAALEAP